jgi:hypothetical protein
MTLRTARQGKNEDAQQFADQRRAFSQKLLRKTNDSVARQIHQESAERMLLASYVAGLVGVVGRQVRYLNPQSIQQAVQFDYRYRKRKNKRGLITIFIRGLKIRLAYSLNLLAKSIVKAKGRDM